MAGGRRAARRRTPASALTELFAADPQRAVRYTRSAAGLALDASKTHLTPSVFEALLGLARQQDVLGWRDRMFAGEAINHTEGRPALHAALRTPELGALSVGGERVDAAVERAQRRMARLVEGIASGELRGADGGPITDVVNIGIGGSDLGPRLACEALAPLARAQPRVHFVANLDPADRESALAGVDPARTLFVVASKTFTTLETLANARAARAQVVAAAGEAGVRHHFAAVTGRPERAREWGIDEERILPLWDWVGGRYSLWSPIGLPVALALGMEGFGELLAGAAAMDRHFRDAPENENLPLWLALVATWYRNFDGAASHVVVPYAQRLASLPAYLQQLEMESNGKSVDRDGEPVDYATAPAIWGQVGTTGQHAFFQWLHQGTERVACDVIAVRGDGDPDRDAARGERARPGRGPARGDAPTRCAAPASTSTCERTAPCPATAATVTLLLDALEPRTLGALLALYEHKVFCQAMIWRINPFDQWGVERGKELARELTGLLGGTGDDSAWDGSTRQLIRRYRGDRVEAPSAQRPAPRAQGEGRRAKGAGRRAKGEGRRAKGEGRRAKGEGRRATGDGRRATGDGRRATGDGRRATEATGDGRRATGEGSRAEDGCRQAMRQRVSPGPYSARRARRRVRAAANARVGLRPKRAYSPFPWALGPSPFALRPSPFALRPQPFSSPPWRARVLRPVQQRDERRLALALDLLGDDVGEVAVDADLGQQQGVDDALVVVDVQRHHLEQVVDAAAGAVALDDLGHLGDRLLEAVEVPRLVAAQGHLDQDGRRVQQALEIDVGVVAADVAVLLEPAHALPARARREPDLLGQLELGDAPVALQRRQDLDVVRVELRCVPARHG
ncbi:MAG: glucose-6-phosphate isomerase [Halofilum sp. (in: g-proteobacteria)]|nr:glucose-6-phosphate isomerase [Halofilum sp. (in: g-proteobacteria)]